MPLLLTTVAMVAFAANSLLARLALADGAMGPLAFTGVRLVAAAVVLSLLMAREGRLGRGLPGSWASALALAGYAVAFSLAYVRLGAAIGALILFAMVQITMISWSLMRGERPGLIEWLGIGAAFAGFVALVFPRLGAPDPLAAALMTLSGLAWGIYSLRGKGEPDPIGATAGNFLRAAPLGVAMIAAALTLETWTLLGLAAGLASGALASGLGYVVWYRAVRGATGAQAAVVQLTAPVIAAVGATLLLGEPLTLHLVGSGALILLGVLVAVVSPKRAAA
ncbi:DMT family transporter [Phreatobacter aquaticus]|uniref:DMT family transporter n=1 Tax=Phreatobacter aquaticus TaxID=2570229 RepID=A0A4D7QPK7_9HYPH|nr:DMT family transporter [Phreatobacter aquaticus]QCK87194.1 DMT family transporter [Phreatobacter aquaticus]